MCQTEECKEIGESLLNFLKMSLSEDLGLEDDNGKVHRLIQAAESWHHLILNHMGEYYE